MARLSSIGRGDIWIFCALCTHHRRSTIAHLIAKVGRDADVNDVERLFKCDHCQTHHGSIRFTQPRSDPKKIRRYQKGSAVRPGSVTVFPYSQFGDLDAAPAEAKPKHFPGSAHALTLVEAADQIAYCRSCSTCGFKERVDLRLAAARLPPGTQVGDLSDGWSCVKCGGSKKTLMSLWLRATTTSRNLQECGFPIWPDDDAWFEQFK